MSLLLLLAATIVPASETFTCTQCRSDGSAGGNRTAARSVSPIGGDLSCAMVRGEWALRWAGSNINYPQKGVKEATGSRQMTWLTEGIHD